MTWDEFRDRLQATLLGLTDRCVLVVSAPADNGYVQFAAGAEQLHAEASGPAYVSGAAGHAADDPTMLAAGWTAPASGQPNWSAELTLPALTSEHAELAGRCVVALQEVLGVVSPDVLRYRAWREPERRPAGVTWEPERLERLDRGQNPLPLPGLGVPAA